MIPTLGNSIRIILGKLGAWPCDFNSEVAVALYDTATRNLPTNGTIVDLTPSSGKSTVVLSAAAFRNGAKVVALIDKATIHPMEEVWFNRAFKTFKIKDVCRAAEEIMNMSADMIVIRGNESVALDVFAKGLKPEGVLFGINLGKLGDVAPEQAGDGWAVWRKPKGVVLSVPDKFEFNERSLVSEESLKAAEIPIPPKIVEEDALVISEQEARMLREAQEG